MQPSFLFRFFCKFDLEFTSAQREIPDRFFLVDTKKKKKIPPPPKKKDRNWFSSVDNDETEKEGRSIS